MEVSSRTYTNVLVLAGAVVALLLFMGRPAPKSGGQAVTVPFKIGVSYGFTGAAARWSKYGRMALELAAEEINQRGGIAGRKLELVFEDSATLPKNSVTSYKKLVSVDKVDAVVSSNWSILTNPLIPLTAEDKTVVVSPTVMDASVESQSDYFYTFGNRVSSLQKPLEAFFELKPEVKRVAFLCWEDAWGRANLDVWMDVAQARGVQVTDVICQGDHTNDFRVDVTRALAKNPDAIFVGMYPERVVKRLSEQDQSMPIFTTSCVLEALDSKEYEATLFNDMYFGYWPPNNVFKERFRQRYGVEPILEAHNHYDVINALAKALATSPNDPRTGLQQLRFQGTSGPIDFQEAPFVNRSPAVLMKIQGYEFSEIKS